jgi:N-methylhydantoinase B/oxoprolinase/acetone carboxylase alpha subunit
MRISILSAAIALSVLAVPALAQQAPTGAVVTANEPGKVAVAETVKASATVSAIDKATRKVSLKAASGKTFEVVAGAGCQELSTRSRWATNWWSSMSRP